MKLLMTSSMRLFSFDAHAFNLFDAEMSDHVKFVGAVSPVTLLKQLSARSVARNSLARSNLSHLQHLKLSNRHWRFDRVSPLNEYLIVIGCATFEILKFFTDEN